MNSTLSVAKLRADRSSLWFTAFFTHSLSLWSYPSVISISPVFLSFICTRDPLCLPHSIPLPLIKHTLGPRFIYGTLGGRCWVPRQMGPISSFGFLMWQQDPSEHSWELWIMLGNGAHAPSFCDWPGCVAPGLNFSPSVEGCTLHPGSLGSLEGECVRPPEHASLP